MRISYASFFSLLLLLVSAKKAAQAAHQESRCVSLLHRIRSSPITTQDLLSTAIAGELDRLTDHPNSSIQTAATCLLDDWRRKMYHDGWRTTGLIKESSISRTTAASKTKSTTTTKIAAQIKNLKRVKGVAAAPVSKKVGACGDHQDEVRSKIRFLLVEALSKVVQEVEYEEDTRKCNPVLVGGHLESVLFRNLGPFTGANKFKWQSILFNLRDPTNPHFRRKILLGEVQPESVVCMDSEKRWQATNDNSRTSKLGCKVCPKST